REQLRNLSHDLLANPHKSSRTDYPAELERCLSASGFAWAITQISGWPGYAPTPLVALDELSAELDVARFLYKDESRRFGLKSFKALGGAYAVFMVLQDRVSQLTGE